MEFVPLSTKKYEKYYKIVGSYLKHDYVLYMFDVHGTVRRDIFL
jgi:hypothetical protein